MDGLFDLNWAVCNEGYAWVEWRGLNSPRDQPSEWVLVPNSSSNISTYRPLREETGLFRSFAQTDLTREAMLKFATAHGSLGGRAKGAVGEDFWVWREEIHAMRRLVELWDWAQEGNTQDLSRVFEWKGEELAYHGPRVSGRSEWRFEREDLDPAGDAADEYRQSGWRERGMEAPADLPPIPYRLPSDLFRPGDVIVPARQYVQSAVDAKIRVSVSPRLTWRADQDRARLQFLPDSLLGALWLQFALAVSGEKAYRYCARSGCRTPFEVSPEAARTNRAFCSDACRYKAYRERQEEARRLHRQGVPFDRIAAQLGSDATTVEGWVHGRNAKPSNRRSLT